LNWEYRVVEFASEMENEEKKVENLPQRWFRSPKLEDLLNKYGLEGWELISFQTVIDYDSDDFLFVAIFKRMKKNNP